jgi:hypothetical protein
MTTPMIDPAPDAESPSSGQGKPVGDAPARLPYEAPALIRFGALDDLTRTVGTRGRRDARRSRSRTGF